MLQNSKTYLQHKDVFKNYVVPRMQESKTDWFNHADEDRGPVPHAQACEEICEGDGGCLQWAMTPDFRCLSTTRPNLGESSRGYESGWMIERVEKWAKKMEACPNADHWIR